MSVFTEKARALRAVTEIHYNCAQSVTVPFAGTAGITEEQAYRTAANFGAGMKMSSVCGAVTGSLMVLGLCGVNDIPTIEAFYAGLKERHKGFLNCADLLRMNEEQGRERKPFCDDLVCECAGLVEEILRERGILS